MPRTAASAIVAVIAALAYALLGGAVSHVPPGALDRAGAAVTGEAPGAAWIFTESCLWPVLVAFGIAGLLVAWRAPAWRRITLTMIVTTIVFWQTSDVLKNIFRRARPPYWIVHQEMSFSYSSGHAMFATIVYAAWAYIIWKSGLPPIVRRIATPLLILWACGVVWSRLALGAHYITDLIGGVLLGTIALALAAISLTVTRKQAAVAAVR